MSALLYKFCEVYVSIWVLCFLHLSVVLYYCMIFFVILLCMSSFFFFFFFFSSRRRHTRCSRDWSSDVCSSDLSVLICWYTWVINTGICITPSNNWRHSGSVRRPVLQFPASLNIFQRQTR